MLRAIIKKQCLLRETFPPHITEEIYTCDFNCEDLESLLRQGGFGADGYERHDLIAVEVVGEKYE